MSWAGGGDGAGKKLDTAFWYKETTAVAWLPELVSGSFAVKILQIESVLQTLHPRHEWPNTNSVKPLGVMSPLSLSLQKGQMLSLLLPLFPEPKCSP